MTWKKARGYGKEVKNEHANITENRIKKQNKSKKFRKEIHKV